MVELEVRGIANALPSERGTNNAVIYPADPMPKDALAQAMFDATSAGRKLAAMRKEVAAISESWSNGAVPNEATTSAALSRVLFRFGVSARDLPNAAAHR